MDWELYPKRGKIKLVEKWGDCWWSKPAYRSQQKAQSKLAELYERELHAYCSCNGTARMFVRRLNNTHVLVNHPIEGRHRTGCPLHTEISGEICAITHGGDCDYNELLTFCLHDTIGESTPGNTVSSVKSQKTAGNRNKLHNLLLQLMADSYSNSFFPKKKLSELGALAKIHAESKHIQFGTETLDKALFYGAKGEYFATQKLTRKGQWNGAGRPHVFLLETINEVTEEGGTLTFDGVERYYQRVIRPGRPNTRGPFLAISSLVLDDDGDVFRHSVCIKPVASRTLLMPVDSHYERLMAEALFRVINEAATETYSCSLTKPVRPKQGPHGEPLLPDFILKVREKKRVVQTHLIEVMGGNDDGYEERKARLVPLMLDSFKANGCHEVDGKRLSTEAHMIALLCINTEFI